MQENQTEIKEKAPRDPNAKGLFSQVNKYLPENLTGDRGRRALTIFGVILLVLVVVLSIDLFLPESQGEQPSFSLFSQQGLEEEDEESTTSQGQVLAMPIFDRVETALNRGIHRAAVIHTTIPTRSRVEVLTYTVEKGDSLFAIADNFGLKPETILWGNFDTLRDNPHTLQPGQQLNILPVNGTYHQ